MVPTPTISALLKSMTTVIDKSLIENMFEEYSNLELRFYLGDWSPTECNAGRFCEAIIAPLSVLDRGFIPNQGPGDFASKLVNEDIDHQLNKVDRRNFSRLISAAYEIRSSRNSVHYAPGYTADYVDSAYMLSACKWMLCDLVRLVTGQVNSATAELLEGIAQLGDPVIFKAGGRAVVMRTDLTAPQELLLLLLDSLGYQATKSELVSMTDGYYTPNAVNTALTRLVSRRQVVKAPSGAFHLSSLGRQAALSLIRKN